MLLSSIVLGLLTASAALEPAAYAFDVENCPKDDRPICYSDSTTCSQCTGAKSVSVNNIPDGYSLDGYQSQDCTGNSLFSYDNGDEGCNDVEFNSMQLVNHGN